MHSQSLKGNLHQTWPQDRRFRRTPILLEAVRSERLRQVRLLLEVGIDVNCQDSETGHTALIRAMFIENTRQRLAVIKTLLKYGGQVGKADHNGKNAFAWACFLGRTDIIQFLLKEIHLDIKLNALDRSGNNNLTLACASGNAIAVRVVAEAFRQFRLDVNQRNANNENALATAHRLGFYDCVRVLVEGNYVKTAMNLDVLCGKNARIISKRNTRVLPHTSAHCKTLPQIFSVYSDHLTLSFPRPRQ